jgi:hypothetical protein
MKKSKYKSLMIGVPPFLGSKTHQIKAGIEACPTKE